MFQGRTIEEIFQVVQAGGGVILNAKFQFPDHLIRLATVAASSGATVILKDTDELNTDEMIRIAQAGKGRVIMEIKVSPKEIESSGK